MRRWERWSLQRRVLTLSAVAVTIAIAMGVAAYAVALDRILYAAALDSARLQGGDIVAAISSGEEPAAISISEVASRGALIQLVDASGRVVAASEPAEMRSRLTALAPPPGRIRTAQVTGLPGEVGEPYAIVAQGVRDPAGTAYVVVVATPLRVETDSVRTATVLLAVGSVLLLLLVLGLMRRTMRGALQPVERIRAEVDRITQVRGRGQITVPPSGDEISRLARTMNQMLARLDQSDASTRRFVSDASHELRSPLATIRAAIEVGKASDAPDPGRDDLILAETLRMQRLVDDLLTLAKADDGVPIAASEVDLDDIVHAEVRRLRALGEQEVRASIGAARVLGDRGRLEQMVRNLVDNATRHTTGAVGLTVGTSEGQVVLYVDNDGDPLPEDQRAAVFERFARLEQSRERDRGGSGLGLAIVRSIATSHGGRVVATETPTGDCRFAVTLPGTDDASSAPLSSAPERSRHGVGSPSP
ncbi:sensor histidine kinase [Knoellia locipacati]|uniref:sensor histidine kinase n=1 Tax=Knoellia locipacati TaxID=882824 RepID=UPI00164A6A1E|nr:HAMP domain-containing sensor histidine kinase [Knoellia locipacati]